MPEPIHVPTAEEVHATCNARIAELEVALDNHHRNTKGAVCLVCSAFEPLPGPDDVRGILRPDTEGSSMGEAWEDRYDGAVICARCGHAGRDHDLSEEYIDMLIRVDCKVCDCDYFRHPPVPDTEGEQDG